MDQVGRYRIIAELGRGGMATVYKAYDPQFDREVAIKVLPPEFLHDPSFARRFYDEARTIARLENRCILPVYDFGQANGMPYIVMRLMVHGSLWDEIKKGPRPTLARVARVIGQVADALDYAHAHHIIHRDLKPANLLLDEDGNVYLSDFGLAKLIGQSQAATGTMVAGTPAYMAPEQARGQMPTPRTDVYALGALAFELLGGQPPFQAPDILALMYLHANEPVPQLKVFRPDAPASVQAVLERAMAKEPAQRYASAGELAATLIPLLGQSWQSGMVSAPPAGVTQLASVAKSPAPASPTAGSPPPISPVSPAPAASSGARPRPVWIIPVLVGVVVLGLCGLVVLTLSASLGPYALAQLRPTVTATPAAPTAEQTATEAATPDLAITSEATPAAAVTSDSTPPGNSRVSAVDGMLLMPISAGTFDMGSADSDTDATSDEKPVHTVTLDFFLMDQTEVTNAQYAKCLTAAACQPPGSQASSSRDSYFGNSAYADYPVINVTWFDAQNYCKWAGRRMPTEAEWEYAARGADASRYPWGTDAPSSDLANFNSNEGDTTAVTRYPSGASPFGVLDMAGNVAEWAADWYDPGYYANSPGTNPSGPSSGTAGVLRGGAWNSSAARIRAAARDSASPNSASDTVGFRCAQ